jgi:hypothetical protein
MGYCQLQHFAAVFAVLFRTLKASAGGPNARIEVAAEVADR